MKLSCRSTVTLFASLWFIALHFAAGASAAPLPGGAVLPKWPRLPSPEVAADAAIVRSGQLELLHSRRPFGGFVVRVAGEPVATGQFGPLLGYAVGGELRWLDLAQAAEQRFTLSGSGRSLRVRYQCADTDGVHWTFELEFSRGSIPSAINIKTEVQVDRDREVAFLPMLMLFPGAGTFGEKKGQGLFAGLEYLENEPSSSEADVVGPASKRQVPDNLKITFPLMAIQNGERYVALAWEPQPQISAVFDSPDRLFASGAHVMGLCFPGSNGKNRVEGSLLPQSTELLAANRQLVLRATLMGGPGKSVVPAVEQYVALRGLPALPQPGMDLPGYVSLAAGGWLDSGIREGNLFRHAVAGDHFKPGPAADAAFWMDWLAAQTRPSALAERLKQTSKDALGAVPRSNLNLSGVGHVRYPVEALVYGDVAEAAAHAEQTGRQLLGSFEADGSIRYHPQPGGPDYAKTHFTNEATGLASRPVMELLEAAAFSGDPGLVKDALSHLHGLDRFRNGVPRGAQTWECPLHTPDILASAWMARAYTLGYELSGERDFLAQAQYWAWTGVPFVYLVNPADKPVGPYSTIAVFGATNWKAPVWLGLPVQWCGLVYADALYRLARHDPKGPWKKLADGIAVSGIQQTWPRSDPANQGLLPDSFVLRAEHRNGPAINPATVQACAVRYFGQTPVYDFVCFKQNSWRVHAPGQIKNAKEKSGHISFQIETWLKQPYYVLVNGLSKEPELKINGKKSDCSAPHQFLKKEGRLILQLQGPAKVELF